VILVLKIEKVADPIFRKVFKQSFLTRLLPRQFQHFPDFYWNPQNHCLNHRHWVNDNRISLLSPNAVQIKSKYQQLPFKIIFKV